MKIQDLYPVPKHKAEFNRSKNKNITSEPGCYVLCNFENEIMYIGQSVDIQTRILQHLETPEKISLTFLGKAYWVYYSKESELKLNHLERGWIHQHTLITGEKPILNKTYGNL